MKTILRIIVILLVASVVAGGFYAAANTTSTTSSLHESAQSQPPMERPEGSDRDGGSVAGGLAGLLTTTIKLTGITLFVLVLEKGLGLLSGRPWKFAQR
jgi:hypothetical protein